MLNILAVLRKQVSAAAATVYKPTAAQPPTLKFGAMLAISLLVVSFGEISAQSSQNSQIKFVNVADSTQSLSDFSQFPAINNRGAVAFVATQNGTAQNVFEWEHHWTKSIASTVDSQFAFFSDNVVLNASGVVGFQASLNAPGRVAGIFTSDGVVTRTIINSAEQGLPAFGIGSPSINASGTVAFFALRNGFRSGLILTGNGGALTPVLDTLTSGFTAFGATAINDSGRIVFRGILPGRNEGIFAFDSSLQDTNKNGGGSAGAPLVTDVADTLSHSFFGFGDPVINGAGTVADFATALTGLEILTASDGSVSSRTDPKNPFADLEHPSINNQGAVAFSALKADGGQAILAELTGGASPITVLQSGDPLFGSTVTGVHVGRFAFNDHLRLAFEYELADGRSGIAVAYLHSNQGKEDEDTE